MSGGYHLNEGMGSNGGGLRAVALTLATNVLDRSGMPWTSTDMRVSHSIP